MKKNEIFYYSFLALPLSFIGLPIYVNISDFYARHFAISLSAIAILLLVVRIIDLLQDPFIGFISDKLAQKNISHKKIIFVSSILLAVSFFWLFNPPVFVQHHLTMIWFVFFLTATYSCFNFSLINFETIAVLVAKNDQQRIAINSVKELCGLIGILLAAAAPAIITSLSKNGDQDSYFYLSLLFTILLFVGLILFQRLPRLEKPPVKTIKFWTTISKISQHKIFLQFVAIFFLNGLAVSIPASVVLFYIADVLLAPKKAGIFLAVYFLSAAIFMRLWKKIAEKRGLVKAWSSSIIGSIATFIFAYFISAEHANWFYAVCIFSGMCLGADLIVPPVIFAKLIHGKDESSSSFVAVWNLSNKSALMLSSFVSLMILSYCGYQPGNENKAQALHSVALVYAILPCAIKMTVILLLQKFAIKLEKSHQTKTDAFLN